jgi:hypothetical protein
VTALIEEPPPALATPLDGTTSTARVTAYAPNHISVRTETSAAGLLVLSEMFDPDWKAYVDGEAVPIYRANHLLRAVAIPASAATVEFRYEVQLAIIGGAVSAATVAAILGTFLVLRFAPSSRWRRPGRRLAARRPAPAHLLELERDRDRIPRGDGHR